ncbi:hypothetical protein PQX77_014523, partial [Marasmius sp. AFHP31]
MAGEQTIRCRKSSFYVTDSRNKPLRVRVRYPTPPTPEPLRPVRPPSTAHPEVMDENDIDF